MREKVETKLVNELVNEYYSSKFVSIFTHQNFLVKVAGEVAESGFLISLSN
jgi:hypothetical protein